MGQFSIRLGKAWSVLRRDGVLRGSRRVIGALARYLEPIPPGDILIVTNGTGDSARYRAHHVAEELGLHGLRTSVALQDHPALPGRIGAFKAVIFHRTPYTPGLARLIRQLKEQGRTILFDTDDLVFDREYAAHMKGLETMNALERKLYENGLGAEIVADPYVTHTTAPTRYLVRKLEEKGKRALVVPNRLSQADVSLGEQLSAERANRKPGTVQDEVRVGYFSGTLSHNADFATITPAIVKLFETYPAFRLVIAGPLDLSTELARYQSRITALPYVPRAEYFENVASVDICLAPLEIGNPFCESKSQLKFFEPGLLGIPAVVAATEPFRDAIEDGVTGFTARDPEEWFAKIEKLLLDPGFRQKMGEAAREKTLRDFTTAHARNEEYYQYLREAVRKT